MKNKIIKGIFSLSLLMALVGCSDDLEKKYYDPERSTTPILSGFFTDILNSDRVRPSYWNVRTFLLLQPAIYSQTTFFSNANTVYQQSDSYTGQYWNDFYAPSGNGNGIMGMYRAMEAAYAKLSDVDKAKQEIFVQAARIVLYDQASQMVDLWGDIPFSKAGSLESSSTISNPAFDSQSELYNIFLSGLKSSATFFSTASSNATFSKADILLMGSIDKWRRYANSLRLRLLMRISNVNESATKADVLEILNNPSDYPLIDGQNSANYNPANVDVLLQPLVTNTNTLKDGLTELSSHFAPDYMLNKVMLPANDPRIPVMFDKYGRTNGSGKFVPNATFKAMPITFTAAEQDASFADYSILDSATFLSNPSLPGIVVTAPEVNFLKAEAYERWGSTVDAKNAYETGVKQSVTFYYYLNSLNMIGLPKVQKPDDGVISTFVTSSTIAYTGTTTDKIGLIITQKWLQFGILQSTQAWSEYRRTKYPQLVFPVASSPNYSAPPTRLIYPSVETLYNSANYEAVKLQDTRSTKIFWDVK